METVEKGTGGVMVGTILEDSEPAGLFYQRIHISSIEGWSEGDPPSPEFVKSVGKKLYNPVLVRPLANGMYEIVDGRRRVRALNINGVDEVEAFVDPSIQPEDVASVSLIANYLRRENVLQAARTVWGKMDAGETEKEIADKHTIDIGVIRSLRDMRNLREELVEAIELGKMKPWSARMAARHPKDTVQQELVDIYHERGYVTSMDVTNARKVKNTQATGELSDLLQNVPSMDTSVDTSDMDQEEAFGAMFGETMEQAAKEIIEKPAPTKISRQDRLKNVRQLAVQARKEILAIESNSRSDDEVDILTFLDEILDCLTVQTEE